ncbi:MAG TPA: hypothetical protein V6C57_21360 [Coleofasciculaceae cyanobacterium]
MNRQNPDLPAIRTVLIARHHTATIYQSAVLPRDWNSVFPLALGTTLDYPVQLHLHRSLHLQRRLEWYSPAGR